MKTESQREANKVATLKVLVANQTRASENRARQLRAHLTPICPATSRIADEGWDCSIESIHRRAHMQTRVLDAILDLG